MTKNADSLRVRELRGALDQFDRILPSRVRELRNGFARALESLLSREGITYGQWRCLRVLCDNDGISQRELAAKLDMSSAAVVFAVNLLERDGIANRVPDPSDKRRFFVTLTKKGYRLEDVLLSESRAIHSRIVAGLTDAELLVLDQLLTKVRLGQLREINRDA
jgi:DNA-binding MarR family transcriptional regulator